MNKHGAINTTDGVEVLNYLEFVEKSEIIRIRLEKISKLMYELKNNENVSEWGSKNMSSTTHTHTHETKRIKRSEVKPTLNYGEWNGNVFAVGDTMFKWQGVKYDREIGPGSWKHPSQCTNHTHSRDSKSR